jgi:hypothetical protein
VRGGKRRAALVAALACLGGGAQVARAGALEADFLADAGARAAALVEVAQRVVPEPISLTWQKRHLGDVALSGPLLELAAADLTGDGKAEILALAPGEAVAVARRDPKQLQVVGRVAFEELPLAAIRSRDPVGSAAVVGGPQGLAWWARSSERAEAAVIAWRHDRLAIIGKEPSFPICPGVALELVRGRNTFAPPEAREDGAGEALAGAACRHDLLDPEGTRLAVEAWVTSEGELSVTTRPRCAPGRACGESVTARASGIGYALALGDLDRDGDPEVAVAARRPPGAAGEVTVFSMREGELVPVHTVEFSGPIAGLAIGDTNGDGQLELVVAGWGPARHPWELSTVN